MGRADGKPVSLPVLNNCPLCERKSITVTVRLLNTAYVKDELNYQFSCIDCWQHTIDYYADLWVEYYHSRL